MTFERNDFLRQDKDDDYWISFLETRHRITTKIIQDWLCSLTSAYILEEACHFCDMSLNHIYGTSNERTSYGWKFDVDSLYNLDPVYEQYKQRRRTMQFLDEVQLSVDLFGETKKPFWEFI